MNATYWNERYLQENTGWDAGSITRPIKEYVDQLDDKSLKILIPGAGNGHEAAYLHQMGFTNVWICDWAEQAMAQFRANNPDFPAAHLIVGDFFKIAELFDLIIEQTFFCALPPNLRPNYTQKVAQLLNTNGKLVGLLFDFPLTETGPPFGGSIEEYQQRFEPYFKLKTLEKSYNSIKPRAGKELFILFEKRK